MRGREELIDLCNQLRGEKLIVASELDQLQLLGDDVSQRLQILLQTDWISYQQQFLVSKLAHSSSETSPHHACQQVENLSRTKFIDSTQKLGRFDAILRQLMVVLLGNSRLVAELLNASDSWLLNEQTAQTKNRSVVDMCQILFSSLYGCCLFSSDEKLVAEVLLHLLRLQLVPSSNPRRLLRRGTCSFSRLYRSFNESMFSAKVFLTCALHDPIMEVLSMDGLHLDIDPTKILDRFTLEERLTKFGTEGSPEYKENLAKHRKTVVTKLLDLTQKFISSLKASLHCFPPVISLIVKMLSDALMQKLRSSPNSSADTEAALISVDLILTYFICPAIAEPESLAIITDTPISAIARHNLMQVAQILQSLAVCQYQRLDPRFQDLYNQFDQECVGHFIRSISNFRSANSSSGNANESTLSLDDIYRTDLSSSNQINVARQTMLISPNGLQEITNFLRRFVDQGCNAECMSPTWKEISDILNKLPAQLPCIEVDTSSNNNGLNSNGSVESIMSKQKESPTLSRTIQRTLRLPRPRMPNSSSFTDRPFSPPNREHSPMTMTPSNSLLDGFACGDDQQRPATPIVRPETLLRLRLTDHHFGATSEPLGEEAFLATTRQTSSAKVNNRDDAATGASTSGKRTRFDLDSIETSASDQLDASTDEERSVSSSLDGMGTQDQALLNDNFSDVDGLPISANVSGRGSPNISGRDTPLSVHTEHPEEEAAQEEDVAPDEAEDAAPSSHSDARTEDANAEEDRQLPALPHTAHKENRADIEEKFGKFEIPQPNRRERHRDETHSLVSDSWSTDVLASDSEFALDMQNQASVHPHHAAQSHALPDLVPGQPPDIPRLDLIAEEIVVAAPPGSPHVLPPMLPPPMPGGMRQTHHLPPPTLVGLEASSGASSAIGSLGACDRSDTWSVDATASDSDADALRNEERMREFDDQPPASSSSAIATTTGGGSTSSSVTAGDLATLIAQQSGSSGGQPSSPRGGDDKNDVRRHSTAGVSSMSDTGSPSSALYVTSSMMTSSSQKLDARRSEPLVAAPMFSATSALINVDSSSSLGSQLRRLEGLGASSNWSEMSTLGSFSQQSVTFSDDSSSDLIQHPQNQSKMMISRTDDSIEEKISPPTSTTADEKPGPSVRMTENVGFVESPEKLMQQRQFNVEDTSPIKMDLTDTSSIPEGDSIGSNSPRRRRKIDYSDTQSPEKPPHFDTVAKRPTSSSGRPPVYHPPFQNQTDPGVLNSSPTNNKEWGKGAFLKTFKLSNLKSKVKRSVTDHAISQALGQRIIGGFSQSGSSRNGGPTTSTSMYFSGSSLQNEASNESTPMETTEQILDKYRRPTDLLQNNLQNSTTAPTPMMENGDLIDMGDTGAVRLIVAPPSETNQSIIMNESIIAEPYYDPNDVTRCRAFLDVKRKLRLVLSSINVGTLAMIGVSMPGFCSPTSKSSASKDSELVQFLNVLLAEALNTCDKVLSSQLREVLRCLSLFDSRGIRKLVKALHEEHRHRGAYISYLQQARLNMLRIKSYLEKLNSRVTREQSLNKDWLIDFCVRLYLDQNCEHQLKQFVDEFKAIQVQDEKTEFVERFLASLHTVMIRDPMWQDASEDQLEYARLSAERYIMALIYIYAFYPNGDADMLRDEVFLEAIKRLSEVISPSHKDLRIPQELHAESPWSLAQAEIAIINAYKTPRDRLGCVLRCCETVVSLLGVSRGGQVSADDFVPVLVFVVVKARPPGLLSTVQYVDAFQGRRLSGAQAYWWTQFRAAVEYIKVMVNEPSTASKNGR